MSAPAAEPRAAPGGRGRLWQGLLGIAVSVAFLVWAMWDVNFAEVGHQLLNAHPGWFALSVITVTLTFPLRTIRWRIVLHSSQGEVPFKPLWHATAIGFMANNIIPARAGEVVRPFAADKLCGVPFSTALTSVVVERILDAIVIVFLLGLGVLAPGFPAGASFGSTNLQALVITTGSVFVAALVVLIVLVRSRERTLPVAERVLARIVPGRLGSKAVGILHNVVAGLGILHSARDVLRLAWWSTVQWVLNALSFWFAFKAFAVVVPASAALVLQGVVAFGVAIPNAPGFFGVFEGLSKVVLVPYGVSESTAFGFALGTHMGWFVPITIIGLVILARTGLSLKDLRSGGPAPATTPAP